MGRELPLARRHSGCASPPPRISHWPEYDYVIVNSDIEEWTRIEASHGEVFSLLSTADMERDLHEAQIHVTETRTKPRATFG
jgi:hypothetical protein